MCGIVGYLGNKPATPILIQGLKRLEYRGYDSAGIALYEAGGIQVVKRSGKVRALEEVLQSQAFTATVGMAHTRWATHGAPTDENAHPHVNGDGTTALIHNGIVENYQVLKHQLQKKGITFRTETDSEVLVHLISDLFRSEQLSFSEAVRIALQKVIGAYGIVVMNASQPDQLVAARMGSPLVLGIGEGEYYLGSDASPIVDHTRNVIYLDDGEMVVLTSDGYEIKKIADNQAVVPTVTELTWSVEEIEKGHFPHFMLKEIHDQQQTIVDTMRGRLDLEAGTAHLGGIQDCLPRIEQASRFYITACGTSWHAGLIGKYLLEELAGIPVHVEYASEFRYRRTILDSDTVVIAISQSGETADTLAAVRKAKEEGALTMGICNVVGSSIARETHCGIYTHAGPEIGVASTKAFTAQVTVLSMLALMMGRHNHLSLAEGRRIAGAMQSLGDMTRKILSNSDPIEQVARENALAEHFLYLGRGLNFPVALEGALKLKEISYIHAEGYPAAEMKHGPIALIDVKMPVVFIAPHDSTYEKILSNIQEVKSRKGRTIILTDRITSDLKELGDYLIEIPTTHRNIFPILAVIPLQLLAYYLAVLRGCNVDQPRNLAKSVTVE
ncbi:MAG: glutamine--fructose-6-phosphate transaminase (isomerizing) [Candidatus Neomarinimicrobiota bacterium]|nr:MAG: glutamine--fructose-6-phosphate transaminase (isomerizing) [Candidatus Neomarinimicrobiota bacterium]